MTGDHGYAFYRWIWEEHERDEHWIMKFSTDSGFESSLAVNSYNFNDPSNRVKETDFI